LGSYQAVTDNEIAVAFQITDGSKLELGDAIEVDLPNVVSTRTVVRSGNGTVVRIELREDDLHDLRLPMQHGGSRLPTPSRLAERS
jgi:hypothetical protein